MTEVKVIMLVSSFTTIVLFSIPLVEEFFRRQARKKKLKALVKSSLKKYGNNFTVPRRLRV